MHSTQLTHMLYLAVSRSVLVGLDEHCLDNSGSNATCTSLAFTAHEALCLENLNVLKKALQRERVQGLKVIVAEALGFSSVLTVFNTKPVKPLIAFELEHTLSAKLDAYQWDYVCLSETTDYKQVLCTGVLKSVIQPLVDVCASLKVSLDSLQLETACNAWLLDRQKKDLALSLALGVYASERHILNLLSPGMRLDSLFKRYQSTVVGVLACTLALGLGLNVLLQNAIRHLKTDTATLALKVDELKHFEKDWLYNVSKIHALERDIQDGLKLAEYQLYWPSVLKTLQLALHTAGHAWIEELDAFRNHRDDSIHLHLKGSMLHTVHKPLSLALQEASTPKDRIACMMSHIEQSELCTQILNTKIYAKNDKDYSFEVDVLLKTP